MQVHPAPGAAVQPPRHKIADDIAGLLGDEQPPLDLTDPAGARAVSRGRARRRNTPRLHRDEIDVRDHAIDGPDGGAITVRSYTPRAPGGPLPGLVHLHGGAFMVGDLETEDRDCRLACVRASCIVLSVDYRLAPEHPYPAAVNDAFCALQWAADDAPALGVDPTRLAIGGASAGGCIAAATALMARDRGGPELRLQLLTYPVLDDRLQTGSSQWRDTPVFSHTEAAVMWDRYLASADRRDLSPYAAPARAMDLSGLPPAYILVAEVDPLRDEALDFALRLLDARVPVDLHHFAGAVHGFEKIGDSALGRRATDDRHEALAAALHPHDTR
jgi:acetyl esterase/lipase